MSDLKTWRVGRFSFFRLRRSDSRFGLSDKEGFDLPFALQMFQDIRRYTWNDQLNHVQNEDLVLGDVIQPTGFLGELRETLRKWAQKPCSYR